MLKTLLPPNATPLETALDNSMAKAFDHPVDIDKLWSAETCPIELLPFLAWALSVDVWNSNWPEHVKRKVIATCAYVHRFKGTAAGLKTALASLDHGLQLSEWFEYGGDPYTFRVDVLVATRGVNEAEIKMIKSAIANTKNARSWLERLRIYLTGIGTAKAANGAIMGQSIVVQPWTPKVPVMNASPRSGSAIHIVQTVSTGAPQ